MRHTSSALCIAAVMLFAVPSAAQPFRTDTQFFGVGFGAKGSTTMVGGTWERGVGNKLGDGYIGVGALGGLYFGGNTGRFSSGTVFALGGQGNYHFDFKQLWFDLYTGLTLTAFFGSGSGVDVGLQFGGRYLFQNGLAASLRLSIGGFTTVMIGVDF
jgi:hypothetical protein